MRVLVIRHGETEFNVKNLLQGHADSPLTSRGLAQAGLLGKYLAEQHVHIDAVWSSDLLRCSSTVERILTELPRGKETRRVFSRELRERSLGPLEAMHWDDAISMAEAAGKTISDYGEVSTVAVINGRHC